ncbi:Replication factor A protein [Lachnellula subtilissima]|uniref:Replication factor A protein n=1 Tax=Lachnellula subtilissima TaxID=602034 RepID=A0A8H8UIN0_9HELO|nr:Replication factor A protein [Lachnellula subtilissima]
MANYGYQGAYSTTTYGNQNAAVEGGGFMNGSQSGSQDSPGGTKTYGKDTLRPVTIKQLIEAQQPHPDSEFKIDGADVTQITFVGQINSISSQATNTTYKLDDGTGLIEVKQWIDADAIADSTKQLPKEGEYLRVWGRIKAFNNKRHIAVHVLRPITNFNEISCHLLEATAVHLYFTRGPPTGGEVKAEGGGDGGMFVDSNGGAAGGTSNASKVTKMSPIARKVYELLKSSTQSNEGLHVNVIAQQLHVPANDVYKAGDEFVKEIVSATTITSKAYHGDLQTMSQKRVPQQSAKLFRGRELVSPS